MAKKLYNQAQKESIEEDVYTEEGREELIEEDEISDAEEGFTQGYEQGEKHVKCQNCSKLLTDEYVVEREFHGDTYYFCSISCAETYIAKKRIVYVK